MVAAKVTTAISQSGERSADVPALPATSAAGPFFVDPACNGTIGHRHRE